MTVSHCNTCGVGVWGERSVKGKSKTRVNSNGRAEIPLFQQSFLAATLFMLMRTGKNPNPETWFLQPIERRLPSPVLDMTWHKTHWHLGFGSDCSACRRLCDSWMDESHDLDKFPIDLRAWQSCTNTRYITRLSNTTARDMDFDLMLITIQYNPQEEIGWDVTYSYKNSQKQTDSKKPRTTHQSCTAPNDSSLVMSYIRMKPMAPR